MKTTLNQESLSYGSTELMTVLILSLVALVIVAIMAIHYRCKLRKAHKVIIRLMCKKSIFCQESRKLTHVLIAVLLLTTACVNNISEKEEIPTLVPTEANSQLRVITRTGEDDAIISYPLHLYVFDESTSKCTEKKTLNDASQDILFKLPKGSYTLLALAGATEEKYDLPTAENALMNTVIALREEETHADLMTDKASIVLQENNEHNLTIALERKVLLLNSVNVKNMPINITEVSLIISPIYNNILLNGSYTTDIKNMHTVGLNKSPDNTVWTAPADSYFLPGSDKRTITLTTTDNQNNKKSYSFNSNKILQASYKLDISATYSTDGNIALSGVVSGASWEGTTEISFNFDENGSTENGEGSSDEDVTNEIPQAGSVYRGCYVMSVATSPASTTLTLLAPKEITNVDKNKIAEAISAGTPAGTTITGWRLPTTNEARVLFDTYTASSTAINGALTTMGGDALIAGNPYFCTGSADRTEVFRIGNSSFTTDAFFTGTATVRAITTTNLTIKK